MDKLLLLFILFVSYSFFGWIVETITCSILKRKLVLDRGFLMGPYCPIYGGCSIFMILFLSEYKTDPIVLFILTIFAASVIEYVTSVIMEKVFKARWWDYSNLKFNLEGRICLKNAVLFGLLGLVFMYFINPLYSDFLNSFPKTILSIIGIIVFILFMMDAIISYTIMLKLRTKIRHINHDSSSEIDREMRQFLLKYRYSIQRLFRAFPRVKITIPKGDNIASNVQKKLEELDQIRLKRKEKINKRKEKVKSLRAKNASEKKLTKAKEKLKKQKKSKID